MENGKRLGGYGRTVGWRRGHGLNNEQIAGLFKTSAAHIRQLDHRGRHFRTASEILPPILLEDSGIGTPPGTELRKFLGVRTTDEYTTIPGRSKQSIAKAESQLEELATRFWVGVRYEQGIAQLRSLLPAIGHPAHFRYVRHGARIRELLAETYLHHGKSVNGLGEGLRAYHLYRIAFDESRDPFDLVR